MPNTPATFGRKRAYRSGGSATIRDRSSSYQKLRKRILRDEPLCRYCRSHGHVTAATVVDHVLALALGGTDDPANLAPACRPCNDAKATAEKAFLAKGYDIADARLDHDLGEWFARARLK